MVFRLPVFFSHFSACGSSAVLFCVISYVELVVVAVAEGVVVSGM